MWVTAFLGLVAGIGVGWFSYRAQAWFFDICLSVWAFMCFAGFHLARVGFLAAGPLGEAKRSLEFSAELMGGDMDAVRETLPVWTRVALAVPGEVLLFMTMASVAGFLSRFACHVKTRCYTDPPPVLTREQLRAKLWQEMKYSDDLLD